MLTRSVATERQSSGATGGLRAHLRRALPPLAATLAGSACWVVVMTGSAVAALWLHGWQTPDKYVTVAMLFAVGAALAFPVGLMAARFAALGKSPEAAFAAAFLALSLATVGFTSCLFAFDYRQYYATWHADFLTIRWMYEFFFTTAGAFAQFAVLGVRLFFPIGFVALFVASIWFARKLR